ncbi:MAG: ComF family protein [Gammaproteobacteria bacterium]|nr:ComF family protein [Gammaproteobacteria bacterium]
MLIDFLFPYKCLLCQSRSDQRRDLCTYCQESMQPAGLRCWGCGRKVEHAENPFCGQCIKAPPAYDRVITALDYAVESAYLLHGFKFHQQFASGRVLAELLEIALCKAYQDRAWPEILLPVPLHYKRLYSRGFNQALAMARNLNVPCSIDYKALKRVRYTPRQVGLSGMRRKRNLRGAFTVNAALTGKHVALIDDVITSGSTLQAICVELKKAGVQRVDVWCAIRTQFN